MFIDDEKLAIHHNIIFIALKEFLGTNTIVEVTDKWSVYRFIQILDTENCFNLSHTSFKN